MAEPDNWLDDDDLAQFVQPSTPVVRSTAEEAAKIFRDHADVAALVLVEIATNSTSERNRMAAAKYICDRVLGRIGEAKPEQENNPYDIFSSILREPTAAERSSGRSVTRG